MTDQQPPNFDAAPTAALWEQEMKRIVGTLRPGRNVQDFDAWQTELRRQYGHHPYGRLRRAVSLMLTQSDEMPTPMLFGLWIREAERQLNDERRLNQGLLPVDETRWEAEERERFAEIAARVGPGSAPMEWAICRGIARQRWRQDQVTAWRQRTGAKPDESPPTSLTGRWRDLLPRATDNPGDDGAPLGSHPDDPADDLIEAVYQERRKAGIPIGRNPTATSRYWGKHDWTHVGAVFGSDPGRWLRRQGGFKTTREILEERRREGRLEPQMEEHLLRKIEEEERDDPTQGQDRAPRDDSA